LASGIERIVRRSRSDVRPEQFERRARLVSAIARGRRWLDDVRKMLTGGQLRGWAARVR
jgi:hypothetical protein